MNADRNRILFLVLLSIYVYLRASAVPVLAQAQREGLDSLSDDAVLDELASRGLDNLLDYAFTAYKVPPERQSGVRTIIALRRLGDPASRLTAQQRQKLINDIVRGINAAVPTMRDPKLMMRQAADLITAGVERDVNTLEYWGENPRTQGQLRPVVQTVITLLNRCVELATQEAEAAANKIKGPQDTAAITRYDQLEQLAKDAEYTKYMTDYYLVLATDRADPKRKEIAGKAIEYLKQYDTPDQPQIRARVRNRIGKLALAIGDLDMARTMFDGVIKADRTEFPQPPDIGVQYEARYFRAIAELNAQKPDEAMKMVDELVAWQEGALPRPESATNAQAKDRAKEAREGASAAAAMLRYRILSQQADLASSPQAKQKKNDEAAAVLFQLLKEQPGLQAVVYEQLMGKLSPDAPMSTLEPLMLQGLVRRGESEVRKPQPPYDRVTLDRAYAAAMELRKRPGLDSQVVDSAELLCGFFLDKLDRDVESAAAFLDYLGKHPNSPNATLALDNAQSLIGQLRKDKPDDPQIVALYERFLPIAINPPYNRKQFAYEYARRLQLQNKPAEAMRYFEMVPADDKRALAAHFFLTIALQQQLDSMKPNDPARPQLVQQVQSLANDVNSRMSQALSSASSEDEKASYRSMLSRTLLLAAEMARTEQKDPKRALEMLANFEQQIQGLPDANRRMTDALLVRVQALMSLSQYDAATKELVQLLDREPTRGGRIVYDLLSRLNEQLDAAQAAGNDEQVRAIARNRAQLTGFLVNWAKENANPSVKKLAYGYAVFDAEVQRFAAVNEPDAAARQEHLRKALDLFVKLNTPENVAQYKASLPPETSGLDAIEYDPSVILGLARTQYDLGNFAEARDSFSRLLNDRRLGPPIIPTEENGQERDLDNENYWEAVLKLIRSNLALGSGVEESKSYLKQQLVRWGDRVGGKKWKAEFEKLRKEIIPDYDPNAAATTEPATTTPTQS